MSFVPERDETHDPTTESWVDTANAEGADFPLQNLPFGVFRSQTGGILPRVGVAIGDQILDLHRSEECGLFEGLPGEVHGAVKAQRLNVAMALAPETRTALRRRIFEILRADDPHGARERDLLVAQSDAKMIMPVVVGDYTDFYASIHHATNVGRLFRPDNPLLPNYKWVPIGYHGRSSSVMLGGGPVRRPHGQRKGPDAEVPVYEASKALDYELEVGAYIGRGNPLGREIPIAEVERHLFGLSLVNDWSARDFQAWEYQPLGPFLSKSFLTTVAPWVVTMEALAPFRCPAAPRPEGDPQPLPHLADKGQEGAGAIDIQLDVHVSTGAMRDAGTEPMHLSRGNFRDMYWTLGQMLTHHASNGCNMNPGDLIASGTVSGPNPGSEGCLLERTKRASEPVAIGDEKRGFLENGDEVILSGFCEREGAKRIGFGTCAGVVHGS